MKNSLMEWYEDKNLEIGDINVNRVSIEKEIVPDKQEPEKEDCSAPEKDKEENQEDAVLQNEYKNCIKLIGLIEYLKTKVENHLSLTTVSDFNNPFEKDASKAALKEFANEISNSISEL